MGAAISSASNEAESINKTITDVIMSNSSACKLSTTQIQGLDFGNVDGNVRIGGYNGKQKNVLNMSCVQDSISDAKILNDIAAKLEQQAKASNSGLNFGANASISENVTKAINDVKTSINISNVKTCMAESTQKHVIKFGDVKGNVDIEPVVMEQVNEAVLNCIQNDTNTADAVNKLSTELKQTATASNAGLDMNMLLIAGIIVFIIFIYYILS